MHRPAHPDSPEKPPQQRGQSGLEEKGHGRPARGIESAFRSPRAGRPCPFVGMFDIGRATPARSQLPSRSLRQSTEEIGMRMEYVVHRFSPIERNSGFGRDRLRVRRFPADFLNQQLDFRQFLWAQSADLVLQFPKAHDRELTRKRLQIQSHQQHHPLP